MPEILTEDKEGRLQVGEYLNMDIHDWDEVWDQVYTDEVIIKPKLNKCVFEWSLG